MNWKNVITSAVGATAGTFSAITYFNGFNIAYLALIAALTFLGATVLAYIATLGKSK